MDNLQGKTVFKSLFYLEIYIWINNKVTLLHNSKIQQIISQKIILYQHYVNQIKSVAGRLQFKPVRNKIEVNYNNCENYIFFFRFDLG